MGDAGPSARLDVSRIAIIGAGPVGVSFARYLVAEKHFARIDVYEQRDCVGGIWNLAVPERSKRIPVPQTDPRYGQGNDQESLELESPLYDQLETNIPKSLMAFSDMPFPADAPLFPSHQAVKRYLDEYAQEIWHLIRFSTAVRHVAATVERPGGSERWELRVEHLPTGETVQQVYDAVVVANGHYTVPYLPDITGIAAWNTAHPGTIIHSKAYRRPEDFTDKKVIVVGNSASGLDIAAQIGKHCRPPVLLSSRSVSAFGTIPGGSSREDVDEVVEFLPSSEATRAVRFRSGRVERDIDALVFATGYFYSYPFFSSLQPALVTDGFRTRGLYRHLFSIDHPTLVFPVINLKVVPFPLSQNQAAVVARVWSGRLTLPSGKEMRQWEQDTIAEKGDGKYFHLKRFPEDAAQVNETYLWAERATRRDGLEDNGVGRRGTRWDERQVWLRSRFPDIKATYARRGEDRVRVRTVEELGFDFEAWRRTAEDTELDMFRGGRCDI